MEFLFYRNSRDLVKGTAKRVPSIVLASVLVATLAACGRPETRDSSKNENQQITISFPCEDQFLLARQLSFRVKTTNLKPFSEYDGSYLTFEDKDAQTGRLIVAFTPSGTDFDVNFVGKIPTWERGEVDLVRRHWVEARIISGNSQDKGLPPDSKGTGAGSRIWCDESDLS